LFFTALGFLTRLPVPYLFPYDPAHLSACSRYFPLVGVVVGALVSVLFWLALQAFEPHLALLLSMVLGILLTGAFHEDGFADCCDGFGGGWQKEQVLTIMKDSRLGTYGVIGLLSILALKFAALAALPLEQVIPALLLAHGLSRLVAVSYLLDLPYVQDIDQSKVKPLATGLSVRSAMFATLTVLPLLLLLSLTQALAVLLLLLVFRQLFAVYLKHRLGGYTGDCLGMAQQFAEVLIYLLLVAL
jgi:adenosylcobinamide-GDP ribazoletransferase